MRPVALMREYRNGAAPVAWVPVTGTHAGARRPAPAGCLAPGHAWRCPALHRRARNSSRNPGAVPHGDCVSGVDSVDRRIDTARLEVGMLGHRACRLEALDHRIFVVAVGEDDLRLV